MSEEDLIPVFMPALSAILINAEDKKSSPLDEHEVIEIRDNAACIMMKRDHAEQMDTKRGYKDIDPENCWYDWQMLRRELGRKPDIDPGARFSYVKSEDEEFRNTIKNAQESLAGFRELIHRGGQEYFPLVKVLLTEPEYKAYMWLAVNKDKDDGFIAEIFELPHQFKTYEIGSLIELQDDDVQDWMINDNGTMYGGYSLRYSREKMTESEKLEFDRHIGVTNYA